MNSSNLKPANYGTYWETETVNEDWYKSIFGTRGKAHDAFTTWFSEIYRGGETVDKVIEVGCGRAQYYPTVFAQHAYTGIDISKESIKWCQEHYVDECATFIATDVIESVPDIKADLVFSHAVIDHVYDIEGFIKALAKMSSRYVYISAYYGWFPSLPEHEQTWREEDTCYYNKLSGPRLHEYLVSLGARDVQVYPLVVGNSGNGIMVETVIAFRVQ